MIEWTDSAKRTWAGYLSDTRASLEGTGADPQEVLDDLKRHVDTEAAAAKLSVVTEEDLRKILARIGAPAGTKVELPTAEPSGKPTTPATTKSSRFAAAMLLLFGVLLPAFTILFEWFTGISAAVLFDPIPTWFHDFIVALVPAGNAWLWIVSRRRSRNHENWLGWVNGFALGVCIYYSILYITILPLACLGVIYLGLGMIPLTPYFALIATVSLRVRYCRIIGTAKLPGHIWGASVALGCLLLLQLPETITYYGLSRARSEDKATQNYGIHVLRRFGDRTILLRACYGWLEWRGASQPLDAIAIGSGRDNFDSDFCRETYYRVTGEAFNAVPPPKFYTRAGAWTELDDEYTWDDGLGGDQVAGRVKGLSLFSSRMDTTTEPDAGMAYCQWTMEFKNVSSEPREARAEIALPPGAVVSRVTLWINGEEREAAFGGRSQTRSAYKEEAVERHRDPLLVTTCGPDRVLVQCYPIPPKGGIMKIRLGMTAPLILDSPASGNFVWPCFLERNFNIATDFKHSLWLEQPGPDNKMDGAHEDVAETNLSDSAHATIVHRHPEIDTVWAPAGTNGQFVCETIHPVKVLPPSHIVLVLDGSGGMKNYLPQIARAIEQIPENSEFAVVVASDESQPFKTELKKATADNKAEMEAQLKHLRLAGGQDNLPALEAGWDLADADSGDVVWIHLAEPFELSSDSGISQRLERNSRATRLHEIQLNHGPDRIVENLDGFRSMEHVASFVPGQTGFDRLLGIWSGRIQTFAYTRQLTNDAAGFSSLPQASKHLARLWARDESARLAGSRHNEAATKLAEQNQLVTPLTGAVVLQSQVQYDAHGLNPANPDTVPDIPEPADLTVVALLIGLGVLIRKHRAREEGNDAEDM